MFSFESFLDLPLIWGGLIATAVFVYVIVDGFDLGVGILFPFAPMDKCRDRMMNSILPFWDANETWLVLGGGGLFAAFPLAYSVVMPALYLPITAMLLGLIFRGIAFELRFKAPEGSRQLWDYIFHFGSLFATFMQGMVLGGFVQGIKVEGREFAGGSLDWVTAFSMLTGVSLVFGYTLLGSTWLVMKTEDITQEWARKTASYVVIFVGICMAAVSLSMLFVNERTWPLWLGTPNVFFLAPIPLITLSLFLGIWKNLHNGNEFRPFIYTIFVFLMGFIGLAVSLWPFVVPFSITLWDGAAAPESQSIMLIGALLLLPVVLTYTGYCYYLFRGKSSHEHSHY